MGTSVNRIWVYGVVKISPTPLLMDITLDPWKHMVWCSISSAGNTGTIFLGDTVKVECYLELLQGQFLLNKK